MKKLSIKKLSILGLVLMAASAVTAAILPSKANSNNSNLADDGVLIDSTGGLGDQLTCVTAAANFNCSKTEGSSINTTTNQANASSDGTQSAGGNNTSAA